MSGFVQSRGNPMWLPSSARSAHDEAMTKEKSVLRKVAMREEQAGATPARAREEVGVRHEAAPAKAIGVAEAIRSAKARKVRHVRADKAVKGRSVVIGRSISDNWRGRLLNDDARRWRWRDSSQHIAR